MRQNLASLSSRLTNGPLGAMEDPLDPVEDCSDGEAEAAEAPRTPVRHCAPCDEAEAWAPGAADPFDLQAFDAVEEELLKLGEDKAPSEASEAEEEDLEGALPEEEWERWSSKERSMWQRVRPESLRREAQQVLGLKMPDAVLTRLLRLHPQFQSKSSQALEIINLSTVLLLQAVARATVRGKTEGQRITFEDFKSACNTVKELHFLQPFSCTFDNSTFSTRAEARSKDAGQREADGEITPDTQEVKKAQIEARKRKAQTGRDGPDGPGPKAKVRKTPAAKVAVMGLDTFFRRIDAGA